MDPTTSALLCVDYSETRRAARRLDLLQRELTSRVQLTPPDTGELHQPIDGGLDVVAHAAQDLALRLSRLVWALARVETATNGADEQDAARWRSLDDPALLRKGGR